jgi:uncharacterized protein (UPF0128 family)
MWHVQERGELYTEFWLGNLRERDNLEDVHVDGEIILKLIFKKWDGEAWTGLFRLRIGTVGGPL